MYESKFYCQEPFETGIFFDFDSKSKKFLFERISLAIQRGNAASIRGTFPDSAILSEIFVL
jgi:hypothetical protein